MEIAMVSDFTACINMVNYFKKKPQHKVCRKLNYFQKNLPLRKAFLARGPGPSTVRPSSSGPHELL